jgi:hypothetical protein
LFSALATALWSKVASGLLAFFVCLESCKTASETVAPTKERVTNLVLRGDILRLVSVACTFMQLI